MLSKEQKDERSVATKADSSTAAGIKNVFIICRIIVLKTR
jgi:hypothetical protein